MRITGRCPYCGDRRATHDDEFIYCEGCGATFELPAPDPAPAEDGDVDSRRSESSALSS